VFAAGTYYGSLRRAIVAYKYAGDRRWAQPFAGMLRGFLERHATWLEEYTVVCPVPSFSGPGARRRWGPVELICAELGELTGGAWPVEPLVVKVAESCPVSGKAAPARRAIIARSLRAALYVPQPSAVAGSRVLLVDDVCTSGGTLRAVARVLRDAGAEEVSALVLAQACWRGTGPASTPGAFAGPGSALTRPA
jgi:predicted amidophosphoribosyltransferase